MKTFGLVVHCSKRVSLRPVRTAAGHSWQVPRWPCGSLPAACARFNRCARSLRPEAWPYGGSRPGGWQLPTFGGHAGEAVRSSCAAGIPPVTQVCERPRFRPCFPVGLLAKASRCSTTPGHPQLPSRAMEDHRSGLAGGDQTKPLAADASFLCGCGHRGQRNTEGRALFAPSWGGWAQSYR